MCTSLDNHRPIFELRVTPRVVASPSARPRVLGATFALRTMPCEYICVLHQQQQQQTRGRVDVVAVVAVVKV